MALHYIEHYGFVDDGHSLAHYGVPGMRWRRHQYTGSSSEDYDYSRRRGDASRGSVRASLNLNPHNDSQGVVRRRRTTGESFGDMNRALYYAGRYNTTNNVGVADRSYASNHRAQIAIANAADRKRRREANARAANSRSLGDAYRAREYGNDAVRQRANERYSGNVSRHVARGERINAQQARQYFSRTGNVYGNVGNDIDRREERRSRRNRRSN